MGDLADLLARRIEASSTASEALAAWCAASSTGGVPGVSARVVVDRATDPAAYGGPLDPGPEEELRYREVILHWGETALSRAVNWYLPERLPAAQRTALLETDRPFGLVVKPLAPTRRTTARILGGEGPLPADAILAIHAVVETPTLGPIADVREVYLRTLLAFAPGATHRGRA